MDENTEAWPRLWFQNCWMGDRDGRREILKARVNEIGKHCGLYLFIIFNIFFLLECSCWIVWKFHKKLIQELPYDPAIPLLGTGSDKTVIQKDTYTLVFIIVEFTIAKTWKQPTCPSAEAWVRRCGLYWRVWILCFDLTREYEDFKVMYLGKTQTFRPYQSGWFFSPKRIHPVLWQAAERQTSTVHW